VAKFQSHPAVKYGFQCTDFHTTPATQQHCETSQASQAKVLKTVPLSVSHSRVWPRSWPL